jgi:hypothetical protein
MPVSRTGLVIVVVGVVIVEDEDDVKEKYF